MSTPIKFTLNFIAIMAVQIFVLNDIVIKSSISILGFPAFIPFIYPLFILLLPVSTPNWLGMIIGFFTGITMDMFCNTPGMHASACVLLAYCRPFLLRLFFQQNIKELGNTIPSLFRMGFSTYFIYICLAILIHHLAFYIVQIWSFSQILFILLKTLVSGILSILLIILSQLLFAQKEIRRS